MSVGRREWPPRIMRRGGMVGVWICCWGEKGLGPGKGVEVKVKGKDVLGREKGGIVVDLRFGGVEVGNWLFETAVVE